MSTTEKIQGQSADHLAPDPNVIVPDHVRRAAEAAEAIHAQAYAVTLPEPVTPEPPAPTEAELAARAAAPQEHQQAPTPPVEQHPAPTADEANVSADEWRHRYLSMKGRYDAGQRTIGSMEEQMRQLGTELVRTQALVGQTAAPQQGAPGQSHENLITDQDRENYGDDLIDLSRRAAREAVAPELQQLRAENQRLTQRVSVSSRRDLFASLDRELPNWRQINTSMQFKSWLHLPNIYTSQIRGQMLKAAVDGAEAPKVIQLFRDFLAEAAATGQTAPSAQIEQQAQAPAPRTPALDLETLAAPGRARPASGDSQAPSEKPIYSRADISKFYDDKRRGLYAGRDADAARFEADLTAAQREGRIR